MAETVTPERIVEVASRIFAGLGYDGTTLELIANSVGVPISTITELAGDKREIYVKVMERIFEAQYAIMQKAVDESEPGRAAVHQIADAFLDFNVEYPEFHALWMHRWLADAADAADMEDRYMRPLMHLAARKIRDVMPPDLSPYALLGIMVWCVSGFMASGLLAPGQGMTRADDPATMGYFRDLLHLLLDRMLTRPQDLSSL